MTMQGKTVLITGANSGIGKAAATELARRGAHVVLTARDPQRGAAARDEVRGRSGSASVDLLLGDFCSLDDVRRLAAETSARYPRIDVLVNNAGLMQTEHTTTKDGYETVFQVNHLAPFLLTCLLWPKLAASAPARVVTVASDAHKRGGPLDFDDLHSTKSYFGFGVYGRSKLANMLFTRELARRTAGSGVTANCLHPGVVATGFAADGDTSGIFPLLMRIARPFMLTPEKGAETIVYLASSPDVARVSGRYFARCREKTPHALALDDAAARRLWDVSVALTGAPAIGGA
jgi:NAD(P)-dependent dehydrogenase (short-subunit alcohol dehydrogenase family)